MRHNNTFKAGFVVFNMIIVDLETSGLDNEKCGIWQIGAVDLEDPENTFFEDGRIDDEDLIEEGALKVTGKTEKELRDNKKKSQRELLVNFFNWVEDIKVKIMILIDGILKMEKMQKHQELIRQSLLNSKILK